MEKLVGIMLNDPHRRGPKHKIATLDELIPLLENYFTPMPKRPTLTGLALSIGYSDKKSLFDMAERDNELSTPIKRAIAIIEACHEGNLFSPKCTGSIFWLKNRDWTDRMDLTTGGKPMTPQTVSFLEVNMPEAIESSTRKALDEGEVTVTDTVTEQGDDDTQPTIPLGDAPAPGESPAAV